MAGRWLALARTLLWGLVLSSAGWALQVPEGPALNTFDHVVALPNTPPRGLNPDLPSRPLPPVSSSWSDPSTLIFVGIAHYRDQRCSTTLLNLFSKAKHPERLRIGIVQQIHTEADTFHCVNDFCAAHPKYCKRRDEQIRLLEFTHQLARGPNFARSMQGTLIRDEEFCMQIDSHMDVTQDWDERMLAMWARTENEFAVLSHPPPDLAAMAQPSRVVPHLCQATFKQGAVVSLPPSQAMNLETPLLAPLYSSAFSLSKCHAERKVPADPDLQMIFDADEFAKFARLWTHGYDVYTPTEALVFHDYAGALLLLPGTMKRIDALGRVVNDNPNHNVNSPMEWLTRGRNAAFRRELFDKASHRLQLLLGMDPGARPADLVALTRYGLGVRRSLAQLEDFTGIDLRQRRVFADRCMELHWVPYAHETDPTVSAGDVWGLGAETAAAGGADVPLTGSGSVRTVSLRDYLSLPVRDNFELSPVPAGGEHLAAPEEEVEGALAHNDDELDPDEHVHHGGELWWAFQAVDTLVEDAINAAEARMGVQGYAHRAMKLVLVLAPAFALVVYAAFWLATGGSFTGPRKYLHGGLKRI